MVFSLQQLREVVYIGKTNQNGGNKDLGRTWFVKSYLWKRTFCKEHIKVSSTRWYFQRSVRYRFKRNSSLEKERMS